MEAEVDLTVERLADLFCELDDDTQAKFFVRCAENAKAFKFGNHGQWWEVGRHLRTCACSTLEARDMIEAIHDGMVTGSVVSVVTAPPAGAGEGR